LKKEGSKKMKNMDILIRDALNGNLEKKILHRSTLDVLSILLFDYEIERHNFDDVSAEWGQIILTGETDEGKHSEEYEIIISFDLDRCKRVACASL
jgi:hypothetical protein